MWRRNFISGLGVAMAAVGLVASMACSPDAAAEAAPAAAKEVRLTEEYVDACLAELKAGGHEVTVIDKDVNGGSLIGSRRLIDPTFPIDLAYDSASRLTFSDSRDGHTLVLYVFETPSAYATAMAKADHATSEGVLKSEALTYFISMADKHVYAILLSEQKKLPRRDKSDLAKAFLKVMDKKRKAAAERGK